MDFFLNQVLILNNKHEGNLIYMRGLFENHLSKLFDDLSIHESSINENVKDKYKQCSFYDFVDFCPRVSPDEIKEGFILAFNSVGNYYSLNNYSNETYFFSVLRKLLEGIVTNKNTFNNYSNKEYIFSVVDAFKKIHKSNPNLDPGYFNVAFLSALSQKTNQAINKQEEVEILNYFLENKKPSFLNFLNKETNYNSKEIKNHTYNSFMERDIPVALNYYIRLLMKSKINQNLFKDIIWNNVSNKQMQLFVKAGTSPYIREGLNIKNLEFNRIDEDVLLNKIGVPSLVELRKNNLIDEPVNETLNLILVKYASPEEVAEIYLQRVLSNNKKSLNISIYDKKAFGEKCFECYFTDNMVEKIVSEIGLSVLNDNNKYNKKNKIKSLKDLQHHFRMIRAKAEKEMLNNNVELCKPTKYNRL